MRTKEEIKQQVDGLEAMKAWLPEYSKLGTQNWAVFDIELAILSGEVDIDDIDEETEDFEVYTGAWDAQNWLDDSINYDLFETN